jgi:hypothetical protein
MRHAVMSSLAAACVLVCFNDPLVPNVSFQTPVPPPSLGPWEPGFPRHGPDIQNRMEMEMEMEMEVEVEWAHIGTHVTL